MMMEISKLEKLISEKIRTLMDISKVSNELLAKEIGMSVPTIVKIRSADNFYKKGRSAPVSIVEIPDGYSCVYALDDYDFERLKKIFDEMEP